MSFQKSPKTVGISSRILDKIWRSRRVGTSKSSWLTPQVEVHVEVPQLSILLIQRAVGNRPSDHWSEFRVPRPSSYRYSTVHVLSLYNCSSRDTTVPYFRTERYRLRVLPVSKCTGSTAEVLVGSEGGKLVEKKPLLLAPVLLVVQS